MNRTRTAVASLAAAALAAGVLASASPAVPTCTVTWDGGAGNVWWNEAVNWSDDSVPDSADWVCIDAQAGGPLDANITTSVKGVTAAHPVHLTGGLTLTETAADSAFTDLRLSGTLDGDGDAVVSGTFDWAGGRMAGTGSTLSTGTFNIAPGDYGTVYLERNLRTEGTGAWINGYVSGGPGTLWEQAGTFDARGETGYTYNADAADPALLRIPAGGKLIRTAGSGTSRIGFALDNDGRTLVDTGVLEFAGGSAGTTSTGAFDATGTGRTSLASGSFSIGDATFAGVRIDGDARVAVADAATWTGTDMDLDGGRLEGAGTTVASGTLRWDGGAHMSGTGTTRVTGALMIEPGDYSTVYLDRGRTLRAEGTGAWKNGYLQAADDAAIVVAGTFDAHGETGYAYWSTDSDPGARPKVHVLSGGTVTKTLGENESRIDLALENDGTATAASGTLGFHGGGAGVSTGHFGGGAAARASLVAGDFAIGNATFAGVRIDGGRAVVEPGAEWAGSDLTLQSGAIAGTGTTKATGTLSWRGGNMSDAGTTRVTGTLTITPGDYATVYLDRGRTLSTEGGGSWSAGYISAGDDVLWESSGTFDARGETGYAYWQTDADPGAPPRVHVTPTSTFTKTAGTGETRLDVALDFDGLVTAESGRLGWHGGGSGVSEGDLGGSASGAAVLVAGDWGVGNATFSGGQVDGGHVTVQEGATWSGGELVLRSGSIGGPGDVTASTALRWRGGRMSGAGTTRVTGELDIDPGDYATVHLDGGRRLRSEGSGAWKRGYLAMGEGSVWENAGTLDARSETGYLYRDGCCDGAAPRIANTGTLEKTAGTGATRIDAQLHHLAGTIVEHTGSLEFHGGGLVAGASSGGTLASGEFVLQDGAALGGARVGGADLVVPAGAVATLDGGRIDGAELRGPGEIVLDGTVRWLFGAMTGDGPTTISSGATLEVEGSLSTTRDVYSRGTTVLEGGAISQQEDSSWHNAGTIDIAPAFSGWSSYGVNVLVNTGLIRTSPQETDWVTLPAVENDGTIRIPRGDVTMQSFMQTVDERVELELGGTTAGSQHGRISTSASRLSGTLAVTLSEGYAPAEMDSFAVLEGYEPGGQFSTIEGLDFAGPGTFTATYDTSGLTLTANGVGAAQQAQPGPAPAADGSRNAAVAATLVAVDDLVRLRPGRAVNLLANDTVVEGARVELVSRPRHVRVRVDRRTGLLRVRLGRSKVRRLRLRYRLVAPDGSRSRTASVRIRIARRKSS